MNLSYPEYIALKKGSRIISSEVGLLSHISKLPLLEGDPSLIAYGIWPCNTTVLGGKKYAGRSSGVGIDAKSALIGTIGETVERYCASFYKDEDLIFSSYKNLKQKAIHPSQFALFHEKQYADINFPLVKFTEDTEVHWVTCIDLVTGEEVLYPGIFMYIPWVEDEEWMGMATSTGLAAHTNIYKGMQIALYEVIERDSFVITWVQHLDAPKIKIDADVQAFLDERFPKNYEFHFLDVTYDLEVPAVFGFCFGEAEYGKFVAVGTACRATKGEALKKVITEIGQAVSYFRYLLGERLDWMPKSFDEISSFEDHSIFYIKRPEHCHIFDKWRNKEAEVEIDFHEKMEHSDEEEIRKILRVFKKKGYPVLFKEITTPDVEQVGFKSIRITVPQLIQMAGAYQLYFNGGERLYEVPKLMGYTSNDYDNLNDYPHPFP